MTKMDRCKVCQRGFKRKYRRRGVRQIYCSKSCKYQDAWETLVCKTCGKQYRRNKMGTKSRLYCSMSCHQRHPCDFCGAIIIGRQTWQSKVRRYCSKQCAKAHHSWQNGTMNYVVRGFAMTIRRLGKLACEKCGFSEPAGLAVHHRDGNHQNNSVENLQTLCGTCHALEHWSTSAKRAREATLAKWIAKHIGKKGN